MLEMHEKYTNVIRGIVKGTPPPSKQTIGDDHAAYKMDYLYMYSYMKLNCFIELGVFNNVCNVHFVTFK